MNSCVSCAHEPAMETTPELVVDLPSDTATLRSQLRDLSAIRIAFGLAGPTGVVTAASRRSSFPTPFERFLLQSIITQAEVALRDAALMTALHHANEDLERRVVERTRQLRESEQRFRDYAE